VNGFFATLAIVDKRMLLYRGGATPRLVADLAVDAVSEDLFDNGLGTWLPAIIVTVSDGARLGFYPLKAGRIPGCSQSESDRRDVTKRLVPAAGPGALDLFQARLPVGRFRDRR
jgi:hypothetical protein